MKHFNFVLPLVLLLGFAGNALAWRGHGSQGGVGQPGAVQHISGNRGFQGGRQAGIASARQPIAARNPGAQHGFGNVNRGRGEFRPGPDRHFAHGHARTHARIATLIAAPLFLPWPDQFAYVAAPYYAEPVSSTGIWYYCDNPQGYYPAVRECPAGWQLVTPGIQPPPY